jgi:protein-S-isoprenylcysteine O-methyltransferase Ste14
MILRAVRLIAITLAIMALVLFPLAGTLNWIGAQILLASLGAGNLIMTLWLGWKDPALLKERTTRPKGKNMARFDQIISLLFNAFLLGWIGFMALDARWHGVSQLPVSTSIAAGGLIVLGYVLATRVLLKNTFAIGTIRSQPERGQKVIDTGSYALVRHPMYAAVLLSYLAFPFALGSTAGLWGLPMPVLFLGLRGVYEERLLRRELPGYDDYMKRVRYRLIPFIW